ncbi:MAG: SurA N-terminal domain-containing protein, partial [Tepidiformaceae bacterium]
MKRPYLLIVASLGATVAVIATAVGISVAQSGTGVAIQDLDALATAGPDTAIVAIVNGQAITRRTIDVDYALAQQGSVGDAAGRSATGLSKQDLLNTEIENVLLAQAATKAGVVVTDAEVTQAVEAGVAGPLSSPSEPAGARELELAALRAVGVSPEYVLKDPSVRAALWEFVVIN